MNFPSDPMRQHALFVQALCQDWLDTGIVTVQPEHTPRANAVREIVRAIAGGTVAGAPSGLSPCGSQAKPLIDYRKENDNGRG
jgi:hypothetical protein